LIDKRETLFLTLRGNWQRLALIFLRFFRSQYPYKGAGPALTDLLSGNIQVMFDSLGTALPPIKAGLLRPLGVSSTERIGDLPDVPTMAESGYPDYRVSVWYGVAAPRQDSG
jgi:tripartite-type tricarboxylate transporter receptor subunit TctC